MLDKITNVEWSEVKKAPFSFVAAIISGAVFATMFWMWFYSDRMNVLQQNIVRYRIAAGLDKPTGKTTLTDLTNSELKQKVSPLQKESERSYLFTTIT